MTTRKLLSGAAKNCGCEWVPSARECDLSGQRFGKLVAVSPTKKRMDSGSVVWLCQCDCGKQKEATVKRLRRGKVRSCGCLRKDRTQRSAHLAEATAGGIPENARNGLRSDNTSGYTGVYRLKDGYYQAKISFKKKSYYLGRYKDINDAVRARKTAEEMQDDFLEWYHFLYNERNCDGTKQKNCPEGAQAGEILRKLWKEL